MADQMWITDDALRTIADASHPDRHPDGQVRDMAAELLALRARVAELEDARDIAEGQARLHCTEAITARDRVAELEAAHARLVEDTASTVRRFSATLDERDALRARVAELEAAVADRVADGVGIQNLGIADGAAVLTMAPTTEEARHLVAVMSMACGRMLDDDQAPNYVEFEVGPAGQPGYVVHVRRAGGPSPHSLRQAAEARAERAEERVERAEERVAELEAEAQADACATDEVRGDLNDAIDRAAAAETARAALIASWEAEANEHRLTGHFGIAEGLRIAIDGLREVGEPTRSRPRAKAAGFFGYIPAVTRTGRGLEPADHHRVAQDPGPVAVWSDGPPEPPGRLIGYAVAFNDGGGWQVDTVRLDGSWDDAELRHHDWLSGGGYQALVVGLREVGDRG